MDVLSDGLFDSSGTQAPGTDLHSLYCSGLWIHNAQFLKIGIPDLLCFVMRVTYTVSYYRSFAADLTKSRHNKLLSKKSGCFLNYIEDFCKYFLILFQISVLKPGNLSGDANSSSIQAVPLLQGHASTGCPRYQPFCGMLPF